MIGSQLSRPEKGWGCDAEGKDHVLPCSTSSGSTGEGLFGKRRGVQTWWLAMGWAGSGPQGWGPRGALGLILLHRGTGPGKRWGAGCGEQCPQSLILPG